MLISSMAARLDHALIDPLVAPAQQDDAGAGGEPAHSLLRERPAARREADQRPPSAAAATARIHHVRAHHHAGAAAERRVIDAAVAVGGEVADVDRIQRPHALASARPASECAERPGKHLREQGQHRGAPGHAAGLLLRCGDRSRPCGGFTITRPARDIHLRDTRPG